MYTHANSAPGGTNYPESCFLEGNLSSMFGKLCKWMDQCLGCIDVAFWTITEGLSLLLITMKTQGVMVINICNPL